MFVSTGPQLGMGLGKETIRRPPQPEQRYQAVSVGLRFDGGGQDDHIDVHRHHASQVGVLAFHSQLAAGEHLDFGPSSAHKSDTFFLDAFVEFLVALAEHAHIHVEVIHLSAGLVARLMHILSEYMQQTREQ